MKTHIILKNLFVEGKKKQQGNTQDEKGDPRKYSKHDESGSHETSSETKHNQGNTLDNEQKNVSKHSNEEFCKMQEGDEEKNNPQTNSEESKERKEGAPQKSSNHGHRAKSLVFKKGLLH